MNPLLSYWQQISAAAEEDIFFILWQSVKAYCNLLKSVFRFAEEITASFRRFGSLVVDWPHKAESKSYFPPKGYAFLLFQDERSVQALIEACIKEEDKLYLCVSSPTIKDKPVSLLSCALTSVCV